MIKVLHTEWSDGWGGQEIRIIEESKAMRELGVDISIACRKCSKIYERAQKEGFKTFLLPFSGSYDIKTILGLIKIIKAEKIDIVNTHSGKDSWTGGIAAKLVGVKFIRTRHLSLPINPSRFNFINELADFVITTGENIKETMIRDNRISPEKVLSIPTGPDEKIFDPAIYDKKQIRANFEIEENVIAVGILAIIRSFKRHDLFLEIAEAITAKYPEVKFFIAGDGPLFDKTANLITQKNLDEKVFMLGHTDKPAEFLAVMDIFVLTSDSKEGVPQSVMQALLMRLPAVVTDVGSVKDLYDKNNLILIEPENTTIFVEKISYLIENEMARKTLANNARKFVLENFSSRNMADKTINIYKKILKIRQ